MQQAKPKGKIEMSRWAAYLAGPILALAAAMACFFGTVTLFPKLEHSVWLRVPVIMVAMGLAFGLTPWLLARALPKVEEDE